MTLAAGLPEPEQVSTLLVFLAAAAAATSGVVLARRGIGPRRYVVPMTAAIALAAAATLLRWLGALGVADDAASRPMYAAAAGAAAIITFAHPDLGPARRRTRLVVDATIAGLSMAVLLWFLAGRPLWERTGDRLDGLVSVAVVAVALTVMRGTVVLSIRHRAQRERAGAAALGAVGFAALAIGTGLHLADHAYPDSAGGGFAGDVAFLFGFVVLSVVVRRMVHGGPELPFAISHDSAAKAVRASPLLSATAASIAMLVDAAQRGQFDLAAAAMLTLVVSAVLIRQSLTLSDNRALSSALRDTVDELEQQATHDSLTELPNRYGLDERIAGAVGRAAQRGTLCAVVFVDVDRLKSVNDSLGHRAGDLLLRVIAGRLVDRVGPCVTRFGGDEFVLVIEDLASPGDADELGRRIVEDTSRPVALEGHQVRSSCSVGVVLAQPGDQPLELLRRADVALYCAKGMGRECVRTYRAADDLSNGADLDLGPELRRALEHDEFTLHYQPVLDLRTGEVVSFEGLLRWNNPERGTLAPDAFLDEAIDAGLLGAIGASSLRRACNDFAEWAPELGGPQSGSPQSGSPQLPLVAVNLSSSELADRRVVERVAAALAESGLAPSRLTLEITEDVIVDEAVRATIDDLCALDVRIAIDDFGTGNSSLRQLGAYPARVLKMDRSFIELLDHDSRARAITASVVGLARNFGLTTVAEGVETSAQAERLARMGCDMAQGWLFARAMPFDELVRWCATSLPTEHYPDRRSSTASASSMIRVNSSATGGRSAIAPTT